MGISIEKYNRRLIKHGTFVGYGLDIIYHWHLQFLNNVIINKTKVLLLSRAYVTLADFSYPVLLLPKL
jgi:hypothetical protein